MALTALSLGPIYGPGPSQPSSKLAKFPAVIATCMSPYLAGVELSSCPISLAVFWSTIKEESQYQSITPSNSAPFHSYYLSLALEFSALSASESTWLLMFLARNPNLYRRPV